MSLFLSPSPLHWFPNPSPSPLPYPLWHWQWFNIFSSKHFYHKKYCVLPIRFWSESNSDNKDSEDKDCDKNSESQQSLNKFMLFLWRITHPLKVLFEWMTKIFRRLHRFLIQFILFLCTNKFSFKVSATYPSLSILKSYSH